MSSNFEREVKRPLNLRNYRPEYDFNHTRKHTVFHPDPNNFGPIEAKFVRTDGRHRLAFLAAAATRNGLFLDLHQIPDVIPVPGEHQEWGAILNDDEPSRLGSMGPSLFDQKSLLILVQRARAIVLNLAGPDGATYAMASAPLAAKGDNCLLIETTTRHATPWREYLGQNRRNAPVAIVSETPAPPLPGLGRAN